MNPYSIDRLGQRVDIAAIREWTAKNAAARRAYYEKPNAVTWAIYARSYR